METLMLNGRWQLRQADNGESSSWMLATAPGSVHTDLIAAGVIPDPFLPRQRAAGDVGGGTTTWSKMCASRR